MGTKCTGPSGNSYPYFHCFLPYFIGPALFIHTHTFHVYLLVDLPTSLIIRKEYYDRAHSCNPPPQLSPLVNLNINRCKEIIWREKATKLRTSGINLLTCKQSLDRMQIIFLYSEIEYNVNATSIHFSIIRTQTECIYSSVYSYKEQPLSKNVG